jgi:uncharacterized lipoprotein YmbA
MKRPLHWRSLALLAILALAAGACRLPTGSKEPRLWLLTPIGEPSQASGIDRVVLVGPIDFPNHLDRRGIVTRTGSNELKVARFEIWGEPLQEDFSRVLGQNLSILSPGTGAVTFPWKGPSLKVAYRLFAQVQRFGSEADGNVHLDVAWSLHRGKDELRVAGGQASILEPVQGGGYAAIVAAMSRALGEFSREVASALTKGG